MKLKIKIVPGSSRNKIVGWLDDTLKVAVTAPPEKGKANQAVKKLLADTFKIQKTNIQIISGQYSPRKVLEISNLTDLSVSKILKAIEVLK